MVPSVPALLVSAVTILLSITSVAGLQTTRPPTASELRTEALDLAYNLDHDRAVELLRRAITLAPDDPAPRRSLAAVLWLRMLFDRGAVTADHYLGSFTNPRIALKKPPAALDTEFRQLVGKAIELAERRVVVAPNDPQAHYDLGSAVGLQASYTATVEGRLMAGFRAARRCYDEHEKVMKLDPKRKDAALIVGTYRYVVSTLSFPVRMMAYVAGFGGGKEHGIQLLEEAAASNADSRTDALFALILVYNRERRYPEALKVLSTLRQMYPRNRLLLLETGATALRGGRAADADAFLTEGLAMLARDPRPRIAGEEALWRFKRGSARLALNRTEEAAADLRAATAPDAQEWAGGRARVELAKLALKRGDKTSAEAPLREAETLCEKGNDPACAEEAHRLLRNTYGR